MLLASTLFWGVPNADGQDGVVKLSPDTGSYCDMKFVPTPEDILFSSTRSLTKASATSSISIDHVITIRLEPMRSMPEGEFCDAEFTRTANDGTQAAM
jgi:hypothetical protein